MLMEASVLEKIGTAAWASEPALWLVMMGGWAGLAVALKLAATDGQPHWLRPVVLVLAVVLGLALLVAFPYPSSWLADVP